MDPNKAYLPFDAATDADYNQCMRERVYRVREAVRAALVVLNQPERNVIDGYYFDGRSLPSLANESRLPLARIRTIHTRALSKLRHELAAFVAEMYGLSTSRVPTCAICLASWRTAAERVLDEKTPEMTWGEVAIRLERAVGWRAPSPQILITHRRKHSQIQPAPKGDTQ